MTAYKFIRANLGTWAVTEMAALFGVSPCAYYRWAKHGTSSRRLDEDARLLELIRGIADKRRDGYDKLYEYADAIKGAYGIFFFQHPSMLEYQERLKSGKGRSNAESILRVSKIPCGNQITRLLDAMDDKAFAPVFDRGLETAQRHKGLDQYLVLGGRHRLVALDWVWFYQSKKIGRPHCLRQKLKDGVTLYYHDMVAAALVKPGHQTVPPLFPEFVRNEDGLEKQDCERNAAKRWLESNAERYEWLNPVFLGDDLYSNYPVCGTIAGKGMHFIFTCKEDSHPWLYGSIDEGNMRGMTVRKWTGREHLEYRYRWHNGVEIREGKPTLAANLLSLEIWNGGKGKATYRNSWVTNLEVNERDVREMAECARARWKIENEHNNVLKHHGYHLEHNFGHGRECACEIYALLNLLSHFRCTGYCCCWTKGIKRPGATSVAATSFSQACGLFSAGSCLGHGRNLSAFSPKRMSLVGKCKIADDRDRD